MSKAAKDREAFLTWFEQKWTVFRNDDMKRAKTRADIVAACRRFKTALTLEGKRHPRFLPYITSGIEMLEAKIGILTADQTPETKRVAQGKPKIKVKLPRWMRRKKDGGNSFPA